MSPLPLVCSLILQRQQVKLPPISKSTILVPTLVPAPPKFLAVPKGYKVDLFAENLRHPRMMAVAPNGDVFVVQTRIEVKTKNHPHEVVVLSEPDANGVPTKRTVWSDKLDMPFGIQFAYGHLYVASTNAIVRWPYQDHQIEAAADPEMILSGIPSNGYRNHWTRNILFSQDRKHLFLTIGSELNLAEEGPRRAVIERYNMDAEGRITGKPMTYATGLRNPIGLATNLNDGRLWANVAERDYKGDNLVPDFLTSIKPGGFYGWPYCYIGQHHDPRMPRKPALEKTAIVPDVLFTAHATPIDVKFLPEGALVALHGSQNRSRLTGYKVVLVPFGKNGKPSGKMRDFVTGWLPAGSNKNIYGRPSGLAVLKDGTILVTDDWAGRIWRIRRDNASSN
jgi:glucose/arabinose dehydrogenase